MHGFVKLNLVVWLSLLLHLIGALTMNLKKRETNQINDTKTTPFISLTLVPQPMIDFVPSLLYFKRNEHALHFVTFVSFI